MALTARRCPPQELLAIAGPMLLRQEALHGRLLGVLSGLARDAEQAADADLAVVVDGSDVIGVGVRTPPYPLQVSDGPPEAQDALAALLADGGSLPGVIGPAGPASDFRDAWTRRTGVAARPGIAMRIHRATEVQAPQGVPGRLRVAEARDAGGLVEWMLEFTAEALPDDPTDHIPAMVGRVIGRDPAEGVLHLWEVDATPVAMAGTTGPTPHAIRVIAVYTPPPLRGRGYASACVAAVTQAELDRGRREVHLSTDLANPTSNAIYRAIGYEPVGDEQVWHFG